MLWQNKIHLIWAVGVLLSVPAAAQERGRPNHLTGEQSPYLLAHSRQPVDWYPWGEPAFEKARAEGKPVFLSVGFATCHWCHLMARESFSDSVVADFLNRNFVSVKVDREERPDVDQAYMGFLQASTGKFGWPLTVFLTPERQPFFAGGYWERDALLRQLRKIDSEWRKEPAAVERAAGKVSTLLKDLYAPGSRGTGQVEPGGLDEAYRWYYSAFDAAHGGFGGAPKYPAPDAYGFRLRYHLISGKQGPLHIVRTSLEKLASSALYDPVGGGFHRYCEDRRWQVPHFEKLLFPEAQLVVSYTELFQLTGEPRLERVVRETLDYLLGELQSPDGGFFSSQDAVGPCREDPRRSCLGAAYVWSEAELRAALAFRQAEPLQIVIAGDQHDPGTLRMAAEVHRRFLPFKVLLLVDGGGLQRELEPRLEMLAAVRRLEQKATAYVCREYQCQFPTNDPIRLGEILDAAGKERPKR